MNTNSAIVAMSRGEVEQTTEQLTFGPYPDKQALKGLEQKGYDGVITLLSTTIIFENELLKEEMENGEEIGLNIHSFPMLPWVGDNSESINGIVELLKSNPDKRYYVHCYLGKHRVDLIKQTIIQKLGESTTSDEGSRRILIPSEFERGSVYTFNNETIILGPYPTDEEWFKLMRLNVKELVTLLDKSSKFYAQEKKIAEEQGMKFKSFQLDSDSPDFEELDKIIDYVRNADHKMYIHGFKNEKKIHHIELMLRKELYPIDTKALPIDFQNGKHETVGGWLVLGPEPTGNEIERLKKARVQKIVYTGDINDRFNTVLNQVKANGLSIEFISSKDKYAKKELYELAERLTKFNSQVYLFGLDPTTQQNLKSIVEGMYYGVDDESLHDKKIKHGSLYVKARKLLLGPVLTSKEWEDIVLQNGINQVILVHAASVQSEKEIDKQQQLADEFNIPLQVIQMDEGYSERLLNRLSSSDDTTYMIVPNELKEMIIDDLKEFR